MKVRICATEGPICLILGFQLDTGARGQVVAKIHLIHERVFFSDRRAPVGVEHPRGVMYPGIGIG